MTTPVQFATPSWPLIQSGIDWDTPIPASA